MVTTGILIPTFRAVKKIQKLIKTIKTSPLNAKLLIIDSSSDDGTADFVREIGIEVIVIPQYEFNHGLTRELGRNYLSTDIVIMMTQDVLPESEDFLERLIEPLTTNKDIAVSYGRQIPHDGADIFESYPREFNYGTEPQTRSINDIDKYGVYTFFCSNSFSAYKNDALDKVGGFSSILTNEDYFAVAKLLKAGFKIAYVPLSIVKHSHNYSMLDEFRRNFDTGYVRSKNPTIQNIVGIAERRGIDYSIGLIKKLREERPEMIPYGILQTVIKLLGYRIGIHSQLLSPHLLKKFSQQVNYWSSIN